MARISRDLASKMVCQAPPCEVSRRVRTALFGWSPAAGLARLRKNSFQVVETGAAAQDLRALDVGADGKVYLGFDRGLLVGVAPSGGGVPDFGLAPTPRSEQVNGILAEPNGGVWFSCGSQLCLLDHGRRARLRSDLWSAARAMGRRCCAIAPGTCGSVDRSTSMSCHAEKRGSGRATAICRNPVTPH